MRDIARKASDRAKLPIRSKRQTGDAASEGLPAPTSTPGKVPRLDDFPPSTSFNIPVPVVEVETWPSGAPKYVKAAPTNGPAGTPTGTVTVAGNAASKPAGTTPEPARFKTWAELSADMNEDYSSNLLLFPDPPSRPAKEDLGPDMPEGEAITDALKLPKGWTHQEPHLDPE